MSGGDAGAGLQKQAALEGNVIDEGAILAAQVLDGPAVAFGFECEVLAREAGVLRKAQVGGARPAHRKPLAHERHVGRLPAGALDQEFAGHGVIVKLSLARLVARSTR